MTIASKLIVACLLAFVSCGGEVTAKQGAKQGLDQSSQIQAEVTAISRKLDILIEQTKQLQGRVRRMHPVIPAGTITYFTNPPSGSNFMWTTSGVEDSNVEMRQMCPVLDCLPNDACLRWEPGTALPNNWVAPTGNYEWYTADADAFNGEIIEGMYIKLPAGSSAPGWSMAQSAPDHQHRMKRTAWSLSASR